MEDGRIKLFVTSRTLCARKQHPDIFQSGSYLPLTVRGAKSDFLCAFAREKDGQFAIVAVPRLYATLLTGDKTSPLGCEVWGDTVLELPPALAAGTFTNAYTGERISAQGDLSSPPLAVSSVLGAFPVTLLLSQ